MCGGIYGCEHVCEHVWRDGWRDTGVGMCVSMCKEYGVRRDVWSGVLRVWRVEGCVEWCA